jgi:hypothetical protein
MVYIVLASLHGEGDAFVLYKGDTSIIRCQQQGRRMAATCAATEGAENRSCDPVFVCASSKSRRNRQVEAEERGSNKSK